MRRVVIAVVVCLGLAAPAFASADVVETGAEVEQELVALRTTDGQPIKDADCRPQVGRWAMIGTQLNGDLWTCYVSDGLSRVYNVTAHVRNTSEGGVDRLTVLNCWPDYSHFSCPSGAKIVLPAQRVAKPAADSNAPLYQETLPLVQRQLLALRTTDGIRIKYAECRPIGSHWSTGGDSQIYGDLWTCYLSDSLSRVYNVNAHVQNSKAGGLDKLTVLNCWTTYAKFSCPRGATAEIVLPHQDQKKGKAKNARNCDPLASAHASSPPAANSFAIARSEEALANLVELLQPHPLNLVTGCAQKSKRQWLCVTYSTSVASRITPGIVRTAETSSASRDVWGTNFLLEPNGQLQPCTATRPYHSTGSRSGSLAGLVSQEGAIPAGQKVGRLTFYSANSKTD
jgi:catabolite regulation protein CreA